MNDKEMSERISQEAEKFGIDRHTLKPDNNHQEDPEKKRALVETESILSRTRADIENYNAVAEKAVPDHLAVENPIGIRQRGTPAVEKATQIIKGIDQADSSSDDQSSIAILNHINVIPGQDVPPNPEDIQMQAEAAVEEAENINKTKTIPIDFSSQKNQSRDILKMRKIIEELRRKSSQLIQDHSEHKPSGWEEKLAEVTKKRRPHTQETISYILTLGKDSADRIYIKVTESTTNGLAYDEKVENQVQITETSDVNVVNATIKYKDPENLGNTLTEGDPKSVSKLFGELYNKANPKPSLLNKGTSWVKNLLQKKEPKE